MLKINRVLLVGLGSIGKRHLGNLKRLLPDAQLTVLRSREGGEPVEGCEIVSSLKAALDFKPQLALICSPSSYHLTVATELAEAGVHLFIEKPLSHQLDGLSEFVVTARRANIKVMVGYNLRFSPSLRALRALIINAEYGRALCVSAAVGQYLPDWRPDVDYRDTVSARAELGGGALLELSHELDYLSWIFGEPVTASGQLLRVSDLDIDVDVEDLVLAHVLFDQGGARVMSSIQLDFLQRKAFRICRVVCEEATLVWNALEDSVEVHQKDKVAVAFQGDKDRNYSYEQEILQFVESILADTPEPIPVEEGVGVIRLVEALRKSSETREVVSL